MMTSIRQVTNKTHIGQSKRLFQFRPHRNPMPTSSKIAINQRAQIHILTVCMVLRALSKSSCSVLVDPLSDLRRFWSVI